MIAPDFRIGFQQSDLNEPLDLAGGFAQKFGGESWPFVMTE